MLPESEAKPKFATRFYVHRNNVVQAILAGAWRTVEFTTRLPNSSDEYRIAAGTYFFRPNHAGWYMLSGQVEFVDNIAAPDFNQLMFCTAANVPYLTAGDEARVTSRWRMALNGIVYLTPNDDVYIKVQTSVVAGVTLNGTIALTYFSVHRLS